MFDPFSTEDDTPAPSHSGEREGHETQGATQTSPPPRRRLKPGRIVAAIGAALLIALMAVAYHWTFNRIYVQPGQSLQLTYKGPPLPFLPGGRPQATPGAFAKVSETGYPQEVGVLENMLGPGRHFLWRGWWETRLVPDVVIPPESVGIVSSKMGRNLPANQFLVEGTLGETEYRGTLRSVLTPGTYRINPYAYEHAIVGVETIDSVSVGGRQQTKYAGWVEIPAGFVGVVTHLSDNPATGVKKGIDPHVLPAGLYAVNPQERNIDIVEVGYREKSLLSELQRDGQGNVVRDISGEPVIADDDSGIKFPSNDGFPINMDFTAVWGIMPEQAPEVIRKFGNVEAVEEKVVVPQIESICRNMGSHIGAVDLLVGESRQAFQTETSAAFRKVLDEKGLTFADGLVRHIYIPQKVRVPIQRSFIADELKLTREQEQLTAKTESTLREAERKVELERERVRVDTEKQVAEVAATGEKTAEETRARQIKEVAAIDRQIAELEAEAQVLLGKAESSAKQMSEEARAEKFELAVAAFGTGEAYNLWTFATNLPEDIDLKLLYAGEGTLWTDLKGFTETMLGREAAERTSESRQTSKR